MGLSSHLFPFCSLRATLFLLVLTLDSSCGHDWYQNINNDRLRFVDYFGFTGKQQEGRLQLNVSNIRFSSTVPMLPNSSSLSQIGFFLFPRRHRSRLSILPWSCYLHSPTSKTIFTLDNIKQQPFINNTKSFNLVYSVMDDEIYNLFFQNCIPTELNVSMCIQSSMYNLDGRTGRRWYLSAHMHPLPWIYSLFLFAYSSFACTWIFSLLKYNVSVIRHQLFVVPVVILKAVSIILELLRLALISHTGCAQCCTSVWLMFMARFLSATPLMAWVVLVVPGSSSKKRSFTLCKQEIALLVFVIFGQAYLTFYGMFWLENCDPAIDKYEEATFYYAYNFVFCLMVILVAGFPASKFLKVAVNAHGKGYETLKMLKQIRSVSCVFLSYNFGIALITFVLESFSATPETLWLSVLLKESATLLCCVFVCFMFRPQLKSPVIITEEVEKAALVTLDTQLDQICVVVLLITLCCHHKEPRSDLSCNGMSPRCLVRVGVQTHKCCVQ